MHRPSCHLKESGMCCYAEHSREVDREIGRHSIQVTLPVRTRVIRPYNAGNPTIDDEAASWVTYLEPNPMFDLTLFRWQQEKVQIDPITLGRIQEVQNASVAPTVCTPLASYCPLKKSK